MNKSDVDKNRKLKLQRIKRKRIKLRLYSNTMYKYNKHLKKAGF